MEKINYFILIMRHESKLYSFFVRLRWIGYLLYYAVPFYVWLMYAIGCIINILILFYYQSSSTFSTYMYKETFVLGLISFCLAGYIVIIYGTRNIPVIVQESKRRALSENPFKRWTLRNTFSCIRQICMGCVKDDTFYFLTFGIFSLLGLLINHLFFIYHLTFLLRIDLLKGVVSAVWLRKTQLFLTFLLLVLIFYYFAIIAFQSFPEQIPHQRCTKLFECLITTFDL